MNGNAFGDKEYVEEKVAYTLDASQPNKYLPRISVSKTVDRVGRARVDKSFRAFEVDDIARVLDFEQVSDAPPDGPMMHCEIDAEGNMTFPNRHFCLRGGFLFYFDLSEVSGTGQSHYITYHGPPIGVVPLDKIQIEFPPGGRRVFREHAHTDARSGYELVVLHTPGDDGEARPPAFLVAESLGQREKWAHALRARADIDSITVLRAVAYTGNTFVTNPILSPKSGGETVGMSVGMPAAASSTPKAGENGKGKSKSRSSRKSSMANKKDDKMGDGDEGIIQEALHEFGKNNFSEKAWIDQYFETHADADAPARCRTMEQWQDAIKKGLKNAVLEQYEYFVEASGEMTTMGREVIALKNLVETQLETIKEMKEIDFGSSIYDNLDDDGSAVDDLLEPGKIRKARRRKPDFGDDQSDVSSVSSSDDFGNGKDRVNVRLQFRDPSKTEGAIEIPAWFDDVTEEITAFVKECRYTDATDLWGKVKRDVNDIMQLHEQPTDNHLTRKQYQQLQALRKSLEELAEMTSNRLVEALRRKNEALKQAFKRERADPMAQMAPAVSPCSLRDDTIPLKLLVKLGKTQEAAMAYSARRSLLLLESLHERPISGTGSVDLVIYAAQLSQAFFSCLASSVEGFLDLFIAPSLNNSKEEQSGDESSIQSLINIRSLPPGALASVVLWCDAELAKFGAAFGGTRILGNLALSPPPRDAEARRGPRVLGQGNDEVDINRDRTAAIEVAAQCVGQAFQYASENLDTVGLPLTPRLAECIRARLKGCEKEVAAMLDEQWHYITVDWEHPPTDDDIPIDERGSIPML